MNPAERIPVTENAVPEQQALERSSTGESTASEGNCPIQLTITCARIDGYGATRQRCSRHALSHALPTLEGIRESASAAVRDAHPTKGIGMALVHLVKGSALLGSALALAGCGVVGWQYQYGGQHFTMTRENIEYHQRAVKDVRTRYGDPSAQEDIAKLNGACELLQKYAAEAPDPGSFTPARDLLDHDARATCGKAQHLTEQAAREAQRRQHEEQRAREQAAREREREAEKNERERQRLVAMLDRDTKTVETCDSTEGARAARKRRAELLDKAPGATVRKQCTPQRETRNVRSECKDANGFVRPCTKTVAGTDIVNYVCPSTMDPELVQLGLYQLDLLDGYPYPEDHSIRVRDSDCDEARARVKQTRERLEGNTANSVAGAQP